MKNKNELTAPNVFTVLRKQQGPCVYRQAIACGLTPASYRNAEMGLDVELGTVLTLASHYGTSVHALIDNNIPLALTEYETFAPIRLDTLAIRRDGQHLPEGTLCGLRYQRKKAHMSIQALAESAGVSMTQIGGIERLGFSVQMHHKLLGKLSRALHCTADDLLELRGLGDLKAGDRSSQHCRSLRRTNVLDNYRVVNNLTFRALAAKIGLSYQGAYVNCGRAQVNMKYIHMLCEADGISFADFMETYASCELSRTRSA